MKKQKYIDHYVMMACLFKSTSTQQQSVGELLSVVLCKQPAADSPLSGMGTFKELAAIY